VTGSGQQAYGGSMLLLGLALLIVGFVLVMPRDSTPGSIGNRQARQGSFQIVSTPGHSSSSRRSVVTRIVVGLVLLAAGLLLLFAA
jgi:hypothetical protein